jgi:hypothetical protein
LEKGGEGRKNSDTERKKEKMEREDREKQRRRRRVEEKDTRRSPKHRGERRAHALRDAVVH